MRSRERDTDSKGKASPREVEKGSIQMTKTINIKNSIISAGIALALAAGLAPATALADTALATTLASSTSASTNFARTMHAFINEDASKVYAATARANGNEAEAQAIEASAAAEVAAAEIATPVVSAPAASAPAAQAQPQAAATAPAAAAPSPNTIQIGSSVIPFVQCYLAPAAPDNTAGLWWGNSSTTDNGLGYFVGHNPGVFAPVVSLSAGDQVTVTDGTGASHTYTVIDIFDVANTTTLQDIQSRITGHGESIAMQACIQGGAFYRVVVAA